jgi:PBP1b-binding outer membrane lipoprotein LpoB
MKTPRIIVALLLAAILTGCVSTAPRAGGDAASRSNGNIAITVNQHGARDGTATSDRRQA